MKPLELKPGNGLKQAFFVARPCEWVGESSTPNSMPWLSSVGDYFYVPCRVSLSSILEKGPVPAKYWLSKKACLGNLRRGERAGKKLPEALLKALQDGAQGQRPGDELTEPPR